MSNQLETIADLVAPFDVELTRLWVVGPGDSCGSCPMRPECPDQRQCLHLTASVGLTTRLDGPFRRFPIGARAVGRVVSDRTPIVVNESLGSLGLADPAWLALHGIRSFGAFPLLDSGDCRGVLAVFSARDLGAREVRGLTACAALLAVVLSRQAGPGSAPPLRTLAEIEREAIQRTLAATQGRVSGPRGAARILGLQPTTLHSRMLKLGVRRPPK